jgi:hypothetical protein
LLAPHTVSEVRAKLEAKGVNGSLAQDDAAFLVLTEFDEDLPQIDARFL